MNLSKKWGVGGALLPYTRQGRELYSTRLRQANRPNHGFFTNQKLRAPFFSLSIYGPKRGPRSRNGTRNKCSVSERVLVGGNNKICDLEPRPTLAQLSRIVVVVYSDIEILNAKNI